MGVSLPSAGILVNVGRVCAKAGRADDTRAAVPKACKSFLRETLIVLSLFVRGRATSYIVLALNRGANKNHAATEISESTGLTGRNGAESSGRRTERALAITPREARRPCYDSVEVAGSLRASPTDFGSVPPR